MRLYRGASDGAGSLSPPPPPLLPPVGEGCDCSSSIRRPPGSTQTMTTATATTANAKGCGSPSGGRPPRPPRLKPPGTAGLSTRQREGVHAALGDSNVSAAGQLSGTGRAFRRLSAANTSTIQQALAATASLGEEVAGSAGMQQLLWSEPGDDHSHMARVRGILEANPDLRRLLEANTGLLHILRDRSVLKSFLESSTSPVRLQRFLVHADHRAAVADIAAHRMQLRRLQELSDRMAAAARRGWNSVGGSPVVSQPREPTPEESRGWLAQHMAASSANSSALRLYWRAYGRAWDVWLPLTICLFLATCFNAMPPWLAALLVPLILWGGTKIAACSSRLPGAHTSIQLSRLPATVSACIVFCTLYVFVVILVPAMWQHFPTLCLVFASAVVLASIFCSITMRSNPGIIDRNGKQCSELETELLPAICPSPRRTKQQVCVVCGVVQPLRSKHCVESDQCVRGYEYYCNTLQTAVGVGNRRSFLSFLVFTLLAQVTFKVLVGAYLVHRATFAALSVSRLQGHISSRTEAAVEELHHANRPDEVNTAVGTAVAGELGMLLLLLFHLCCGAVNLFLLVRSIYCAVANLTVEELESWQRYDHLVDSNGTYRNVFDRGVFNNIRIFCSSPDQQPDWDELVSHAGRDQPTVEIGVHIVGKCVTSLVSAFRSCWSYTPKEVGEVEKDVEVNNVCS